jgi:Ran GTPase-activating protein (RanGAP) involved in mRNA processing and transport
VRALLKGVESHLSEISTLSLAKNLISSAGTEVLGQLVARSQNLRNLCISENPITDEGALLMGSVIKQSNLASLSMRSLSCSAHARESIRSSWGARGWLGLYL